MQQSAAMGDHLQNKSDSPCSFFVTMGDGRGGGNKASVADVAQCEATSLIVGPGETMVLTVKVVRGEEEESLTPNTKLGPGKRYAIVVEEDGKVVTSVVDNHPCFRHEVCKKKRYAVDALR
jgi:hypothetical protein